MKKKRGFDLREIAGQKVVVAQGTENINFGKIIAMNASSAYLWEALGEIEFDAETIAKLLTEKYDVAHERALADAEKVMNAWLEAGIATL